MENCTWLLQQVEQACLIIHSEVSQVHYPVSIKSFIDERIIIYLPIRSSFLSLKLAGKSNSQWTT